MKYDTIVPTSSSAVKNSGIKAEKKEPLPMVPQLDGDLHLNEEDL